ncbi:apolipoprotein L2-like [Hemibagrus wyckioides]|uniref:apolipoprotein L2-like n=1 Tax=Hemibagrus wyckioides TaxID=337641 RepID=UPI00266D3729|nr:apolipoprotein L2-like [Hemibagrus wyckioides]XP_058265565.1 apolipoprotein L2-like [Hemibagrus wyckioides]
MSSNTREKLQQQLRDYISDTLKYTETVKEFYDGESKWTLERKTELEDIRKKKLEKELGEVLEKTLEGLKKLEDFLDAVEKLAVTSLFVFMDESFMPKGVSSVIVRLVISAARIVCPLLVHFKRDAGAFFQPNLSNVEVLAFQLDKYIQVTQQICGEMEEKSRSISGLGWMNWKALWELNLNMTEESVQKLYDHLLQLTKIRMNESFRLNFLFNNKAEDFILIFSERHSRMLQFLSVVDEDAVQLDKMKRGSDISTVAGSSVGFVGGVLTIIGLALAPVTAGVSLGLTIAGAGLGVINSVNGLITSFTEIAVNSHHGTNANNIFSKFQEDVEKILDCLDEVASNETPIAVDGLTFVKFGRVVTRVVGVGNGIGAIVDGASAVKVLRSEEVIAKAVNLGLHEAKAGRSIPQLAADLPDIGQLAIGTPLALSKAARMGNIGLNALFIGLDVFFICKDSISLAKGSKTKAAQLIRSRSVLWRSEVKAWEKIHDHLREGISEFNKNLKILEQHLDF